MEPINEAAAQVQPGKRLAETPPKKGGKAVKAGLAVLVLAAVIFYGVCCYLAHTSTVFFPHTYINGVEVSGLTADAAADAVAQGLRQRELSFQICEPTAPDSGSDAVTPVGDPIVPISCQQLLADTPVHPELIRQFDTAQHSGSLLAKGWHYLRALFSPQERTFSPLNWNESGLNDWLEEANALISYAPIDTTARIENGRLLVTTARDGRFISMDDLRTAVTQTADPHSRDSFSVHITPAVLPAKVLTAEALYNDLHGEMQNASYDAATDSIIPERMGADFDAAAAQAVMDAAAPGETVTLDAVIEMPEVTAAELEKVLFRDVLGEAKTKVGGTASRKTNVKLSAASINGLVLNAGDVFSYNESVGQRTAANGYQPAPAYVKGETVDEIGGGICQTSSTLYLACLRGDLEITERYAHRYIPSYIAAGMDATVSWGGPDYKFTNNTLYPIRIVTEYENGYLTVKLLGTNVTGITAKMTNEKLSSTDYEVVYEESAEQAPGTQKVKTTAYTGSKWRTYRHLYDADGKLISSAYEATSDYKARNKVILVAPGELPGAEPAAPADTPADPSGQSETASPQDAEALILPDAGQTEPGAD